jgi:hypothetical protein
MRNIFLTMALGGTALLGGCAVSDADSTPVPLTEKQAQLLQKQIGGKVAGEPVSCISNMNSDTIIRVSDDMLLYKVSGRLVYQNRLKAPCPGLARDNDIIVSEQFGSQQCRGDIIRLVDRVGGIPGPVCILGDFIPYRKAATGS